MKKSELRQIIREEILLILDQKMYNFRNKKIGTNVNYALKDDKAAEEYRERLGPNWEILD